MPSRDITLCVSLTCPKRWRCGRHVSQRKADADYVTTWQSMADLTPRPGEGCEHFMEMGK